MFVLKRYQIDVFFFSDDFNMLMLKIKENLGKNYFNVFSSKKYF
jgi:hypothetical protein